MPLLFSYGTLQQEDVQRATFGRLLQGQPDQLVGYGRTMVPIDDPEVVKTSGKTHHPIIAFSGNDADRVDGTVFEITDAELAQADAYEVAAYKRVAADTAAGQTVWVYVDARFAPA
ncbi:gamma-glutamylcyclotransferase family protein [Azospirillum griseum]|uniref:Gamma-glutamylcyclotransferase n=1 Tax=Azospirillum griseum TaxID=2496639 RepID=A0A431VJJ1_9PROT|nr:gamma-glutamylcyclotransferase family protein [Azospirillum griseum]RTR20661.1 gamma-glutamylcyclotransferase [Azospirillum griseum]